ncbi:MAG: heme exporter protein CcmB [Deferribacteraceae bacterium]|nr:heme exporter protein CcmB [Deferribacteraceae bacterium]
MRDAQGVDAIAMKTLKYSLVLTLKDLRLEYNTKEIISSMLVFSLLTVVVFSFIFDPGEADLQKAGSGAYWMAVVFSGLLGLSRSMQLEINGGNLEASLIAGIPRNAVFFGKFASNFIIIIFMQIIMIPLFAVLYDVRILSSVWMAAVILGATYGFVLLGTLFSLIAARSGTREILLPLLLLPISIPLILAAVQLTNGFQDGESLGSLGKWLRLIFVYDLIFTVLSALLFEKVVEE